MTGANREQDGETERREQEPWQLSNVAQTIYQYLYLMIRFSVCMQSILAPAEEGHYLHTLSCIILTAGVPLLYSIKPFTSLKVFVLSMTWLRMAPESLLIRALSKTLHIIDHPAICYRSCPQRWSVWSCLAWVQGDIWTVCETLTLLKIEDRQ